MERENDMSSFFALMARMKYIERWGLMRSLQKENIQEHSLQAAMIAHALAIIANQYYGGTYNADAVAVKAMYHEASEIITGDLPTPIKYYNPEIKTAYKYIEGVANEKILSLLPEGLKDTYEDIINIKNEQEKKLVKYADRICAYLKCVEEVNAGNREFADAMASIREDIDAIEAPEVKYFMENFASAFRLTLDKIN